MVLRAGAAFFLAHAVKRDKLWTFHRCFAMWAWRWTQRSLLPTAGPLGPLSHNTCRLAACLSRLSRHHRLRHCATRTTQVSEGAPKTGQPNAAAHAETHNLNSTKKRDMPRTIRVIFFSAAYISLPFRSYCSTNRSIETAAARAQIAYKTRTSPPRRFGRLSWVKSAAWRRARHKPAQYLGSRMWPFPPNPKLSGQPLRNVGVPQDAPSAAQT